MIARSKLLEAGKKLTVRAARQLQEKGLKALRLSDEELIMRYYAGPEFVDALYRLSVHLEDDVAAPQAKPAPQERPTFKVQVDLVTNDIVVRDENGPLRHFPYASFLRGPRFGYWMTFLVGPDHFVCR